jgi:gas vesicle protein
MSSGKVVLGVLAGLAAGAIMGILFAPDSGVNTRKKIVRKSEEYIDDLKDKFNEFVDHVAEKVEKATEEIKEEKA